MASICSCMRRFSQRPEQKYGLANALTGAFHRVVCLCCFGTALVLLFGIIRLPASASETAVQSAPAKQEDPYFAPYHPAQAPAPGKMLLQKGDRLAIIGDSITQQKMYSRLIETYLTVCTPELEIKTRQFGWSGETAAGFRKRMESDCFRFQPTVATLSYGMNDYRYRPYDTANAQWYRDNYTAIVRALKQHGARVVLGSPGCVDQVAKWVKSASGTLQQHNESLCKFRNIGIEIARQEDVRFADIFWPMLTAEFRARKPVWSGLHDRRKGRSAPRLGGTLDYGLCIPARWGWTVTSAPYPST